MDKSSELSNIPEEEILEMIDETSKFAANFNTDILSSAAVAAQGSSALANDVEFWQWMGRNYSGSGIFESNATMQQYIAQGAGKKDWMTKQLQGKGYEWDWMTKQRNNPLNIMNKYDAGDVANRAASDVTETNLLTGNSSEYQMKAYTGESNPHLSNTPKDMTVVTNAEKVEAVKTNGYDKVEKFQNKQAIKKTTNKRLKQIEEGKASAQYNIKNVGGAMGKAGFVGCVIGMGTETIFSYKKWKNGEISDEEYAKEIFQSGGEAGITAGATTGIMIPVTSMITAAGMSTAITMPIAMIIGSAVNKIVAPCFGRGKYKQILSKAKYYQDVENIYEDLVDSMQVASEKYYDFVNGMSRQNAMHQEMKKKSMEMNKDLKDLYDMI